jgi:hypothetical protein
VTLGLGPCPGTPQATPDPFTLSHETLAELRALLDKAIVARRGETRMLSHVLGQLDALAFEPDRTARLTRRDAIRHDMAGLTGTGLDLLHAFLTLQDMLQNPQQPPAPPVPVKRLKVARRKLKRGA